MLQFRNIKLKKLLSRTKLLAGIAFLIFIAAAYFFYHSYAYSQINYVHNGLVDFSLAEQHFKKIISIEGSEKARAAFIAEGNALKGPQSHVLAHAFGSALFKTVGVSGFAECGDEFSYGCYHEFLGEAVTSSGEAIIAPFFTACKGIYSCYHGIGHGIMSYLGYSIQNLNKALSLCDTYNPSKNPRLTPACADGVFMEYNLREVAGYNTVGDLMLQPFSPANPYGPCPSVTNPKFMQACVYGLPVWWIRSTEVGSTTEERVQKTTQYCAALSTASLIKYCIIGAGFVVAKFDNFDAKKISDDCKILSGGGNNKLPCLGGALIHYHLYGSNDLVALCNAFTLTDAEKIECPNYAVY